MEDDSLKKRYSIKLLSNLINALIGMTMVAIVPKALGPFQYGQFSFLQQIYTEIIGFMDAGTSTAFYTKLSANHKRWELISFYALYTVAIFTLLLLGIYFLDIAGYISHIFPNINKKYIYLGFVFGMLAWIVQLLIKISDAQALTVSVEWFKIAHKIFSLLLLIYFVYFLAFDLTNYFYFQHISLIAFIAIIWVLFIKKKIFTRDLMTLRFGMKRIAGEFFHFCSPLIIYMAVGLGASLFDIWLLQKMGGSIQSGYYGLTYSIATMSFLFTASMTPLIAREFSKLYAERNVDSLKGLYTRYIPMLYSIAAFFSIFLAFQSENILTIFTDEKFKDAYFVLVVMAFYPLHQTYSQLSGSLFFATGETRLYRNTGIFTMGVGLFVTVLFLYILQLAAFGLALKMIIIQLLATNIQLYLNTKFLNLKMRHFVWHQLYSILFFTAIAIIVTYLIAFANPLIDLLASSVLYTIFVIILGYLFPQIFATNRNEIKLFYRKIVSAFKK